ncbi:MAG: hypothetical protein AAF231_01900 [Pseudomonadota bacterium]
MLAPLILAYVGPSGLGLWLTSMSLFSLCSIMSMALSGGVVTTLSRMAEDDREAMGKIIRSSLAASMLAGLAIAVMCLVVLGLGGWIHASPSDTPLRHGPFEVLAMVCVLSLSLPLLLPSYVLLSQNQGHIGYMCNGAGMIASTGAVVTLMNAGQPLYLMILLSGLMPAVLSWAVCSLKIQRKGFAAWRPDFRHLGQSKWIWMQGGFQGLGQLANAALNPVDLILIAVFLGTALTAGYGAVQQVMLLPSLFVFAISSAFWPGLSRAHAEGDVVQVKSVYMAGLAVAILCTLIFVVVVVVWRDALLFFWLREAVDVPPFVTLTLGGWALLTSGIGVTLTLLRAIGQGAFLAQMMLACLIVKIGLSVLLLPVIGPLAGVGATIIAAMICIVMPMYRRRHDIFHT